MVDDVPNPGSPEARALGCTCPVLDNDRGRGSGRLDANGEPVFWITEGCPLHSATPEDADRE